MIKRVLVTFSIICCVQHSVNAQQTQAEDSAKFYRDIETISKKNKVTKFIHKIFFKPVTKPVVTVKPGASKKKKTKAKAKVKSIHFTKFEGKPIRDIIITTLDPFGFLLNDTNIAPRSFIQKTGNKLHVKTQRLAVKNLLLFKKNDPFDSLLVRDSERLVRTQNYVREVTIYPMAAGKKSDSVDVYIRVLDAWSIIVDVAGSPTKLVVNITDRNFLGLGHRFENEYTWNHTTGRNAYETFYLVPNIDNTFISTAVRHVSNSQKVRTSILDVQRPFYSAFTKWAWGATYIINSYSETLFQKDTIFQKFQSFTQDYWGGRAYQIFKGREEENRTTNLILAARYSRVHYMDKPDLSLDTLKTYSDANLYLGSVGISTRKYRQDKYLFNYGTTEDIPIGRAYGLTTGFRVKNRTDLYLGMRIAWGNYYHLGYFSANFEYGSFLNSLKFSEGTFIGEVNYFTNLIEVGNWRFRQFVKPQLTLGLTRLPTENLALTNEFGIRGFTADSVIGSHRLVVLLQTQSYAPWNFLGFRFGPYFICALGMIGDEKKGFSKSRLYAQYGLGVLIKNEYLVLNTFQFSVAFYPLIPGAGTDIFKINRYRTYYYGFRDFDIPRPSMIVYQ